MHKSERAIDRRALVDRHRIVYTNESAPHALQVGNGEFAFGVDATGMQTFSGNTMAQWSWHTSPKPQHVRLEDYQYTAWNVGNRSVPYPTLTADAKEAWQYLRENPHRFHLGKIGFILTHPDGKAASIDDIHPLRQELDLWRGIISSEFEFSGSTYTVETCAHPKLDAVGIRVSSAMCASGKTALSIAFPYGDPGINGGVWMNPAAHRSRITPGENGAVIHREMDDAVYAVHLSWDGHAHLHETSPHHFILSPERTDIFAFTVHFTRSTSAPLSFNEIKTASEHHWKDHWMSGGAVDLSECSDDRAFGLERRIVHSQYLLAVNCAGSYPPQESGLYNNSGWYGKFHLEMHWWHGVHNAFWGRWERFEKSIAWYETILPAARRYAQMQGYDGARWPKMTGPDGGESPSNIGPLLIWQQPHPIYYALLDHRLHPNRDTLIKWRDIVHATADFMASYAYADGTGRFILGHALKTMPENNDARKTIDPAFELAYWRFGLRIASEWRTMLGEERNEHWDAVLKDLSPLPSADGVYLLQEGMTATFTAMNWEHPSLIGMGMLPGDGVDPGILRTTVRKVWSEWQWERCWGWDFPMMAMAAARVGETNIAVEALLHPAMKNRFTAAGLSEGGPFPYFPSNGGLLTAIAMMCAGWDGAPMGKNPGFPAHWPVRWEGLHPIP